MHSHSARWLNWKILPKTFINQTISNVDVVSKKHKNQRYQCNNRSKIYQSQWIKYDIDVELKMKL